MEIGKQIKKYRSEMEVSQEELAERIFVSRQTVSNWENDKNYPDLKSLLLLSSLFGVSLDILIKGDIEQMKEEIKTEDRKLLKRYKTIVTVFSIISILSAFPLLALPILMFGLSIYTSIGIGSFILIYAVLVFFAHKVERFTKQHDIHTLKEIVAFMEGQPLNEIDKQREHGKRAYQTFLVFIGTGLLTFAVFMLMFFIYSRLR